MPPPRRTLCAQADGKAGSVKRELGYQGITQRLNLCPDHATQLARLVGAWTFVGEFVDEDTEPYPSADECGRCEAPPASRVHLRWADEDYLIDLCDKHADLLLVDLLPWRNGDDLPPTAMNAVLDQLTDAAFDTVVDRGPESVAVERAEPAKVVIPAPVATEREPAKAPAAVALADRIHPDEAGAWRLTVHAQERLESRGPEGGFSALDVMLACVRPERVLRSIKDDRKWLYGRGRVVAVVDPDDKMVLTVFPASDPQSQEA